MLAGRTRRFSHACEFETSLVLATEPAGTALADRIATRAAGLLPRWVQPRILPGEVTDPITEAGAA